MSVGSLDVIFLIVGFIAVVPLNIVSNLALRAILIKLNRPLSWTNGYQVLGFRRMRWVYLGFAASFLALGDCLPGAETHYFVALMTLVTFNVHTFQAYTERYVSPE
jgi:hypothetical protein